jgi:hypothetical protein
MVLVDVMLATGALDKFDIRRIEMQFKKFGERISLHLFGDGNEGSCRSTDAARTPSRDEIRSG